jgi:hypothetical protein
VSARQWEAHGSPWSARHAWPRQNRTPPRRTGVPCAPVSVTECHSVLGPISGLSCMNCEPRGKFASVCAHIRLGWHAQAGLPGRGLHTDHCLNRPHDRQVPRRLSIVTHASAGRRSWILHSRILEAFGWRGVDCWKTASRLPQAWPQSAPCEVHQAQPVACTWLTGHREATHVNRVRRTASQPPTKHLLVWNSKAAAFA